MIRSGPLLVFDTALAPATQIADEGCVSALPSPQTTATASPLADDGNDPQPTTAALFFSGDDDGRLCHQRPCIPVVTSCSDVHWSQYYRVNSRNLESQNELAPWLVQKLEST
jgi:hypothetical protein